MSKMSKQIANQANAQRSTGPITAAGKARSAMNSRTHGLRAKDILIGPEQQADFDDMAEGYQFALDPDGPVEQTLFNEIVGAAWQLGRVQRMEAEACAGKGSYAEILEDEALQKKLDRLARHHTRIERTFHRCLKQLKSLQKERITPDVKYTTKEIDDKLRRLNESALSAISERTQSAAPSEENEILTPEDLAEIDRDLDRMEAELAAQLRANACCGARERKAA